MERKEVVMMSQNRFWVEGDIAFVEIVGRKNNAIASFDVSGLERVKAAPGPWYCLAPKNYIYAHGPYGRIYLHRLLTNAPDGVAVDHIDNDPTNNRSSNLRLARHQENCWNVGPQARNNTGYKGVTISKKRMKWAANIQANDSGLYLGHYDTPEEAALAYNIAAQLAHGEFAYLNPVPQGTRLSPDAQERLEVKVAARMAGLKKQRNKLTFEDAERMRIEYAQGGISMKKLGERYGIGAAQVCEVIKGSAWPRPA